MKLFNFFFWILLFFLFNPLLYVLLLWDVKRKAHRILGQHQVLPWVGSKLILLQALWVDFIKFFNLFFFRNLFFASLILSFTLCCFGRSTVQFGLDIWFSCVLFNLLSFRFFFCLVRYLNFISPWTCGLQYRREIIVCLIHLVYTKHANGVLNFFSSY